jgi:hypothetical protein
VYVVATSNITLSGQPTIDGLTPGLGYRVLCVGQTNQVQNGIWLVQPGTWVRPSDFATGSAGGVQINVNMGTAYNNTIWMCSNQYGVGGDTIDTNNLTFKQIPSSMAWSQITTTPTTLAGYGITDGVSTSRTISTTGPLTGGGALSSNLTLAISAATESAAGSMSASDKTKLDGLTISGTANYITKFTGANSVGNSVMVDLNNGYAVQIGPSQHGHAFTAAGGYKHITLGTSYFDGTNYVTPGVGTNAISEIITDTNGIAFIALPSTSASTRTDSPATFLGLERFRVNNGGITVQVDDSTGLSAIDNGQLIIRGATNTAYRLALAFDTSLNVGMIQAGVSGIGELPLSLNPKGSNVGIGTAIPRNQLSVVGVSGASDTIPAIGSPGGKFSILNDGGGTPSTAGNYGLLFGVMGTGDAFIQEQRVDGTATAYNLLLQPNGGYLGIGVTSASARLHVGGPVALDCIGTIQAALGVDHEILQAYDSVGSQIVSRHGGGFGDQAVTYANLAGSTTKAPRDQKFCSPYTLTAPASMTQNINLATLGTNMPANRSFVATLTITQRTDAASTTGAAIITLICGTTNSSGNLDAVNITSTPMVAGPGGTIIVTVAVVSSNVFSFSVNDNALTGAITGYWKMEVSWVGT